MSDPIEATSQQVTGLAESAAAQVREQAEALRAGLVAAQPVAKAKLETQGRKLQKQTQKLQKLAVERGHELTEEAASRGKKAAGQASKEAKKRSAAAVASAPAVAAAARKKGEHALEVARERGGEALLTALDTDAGKRLASTGAGTALKSKLTARKRRRRKLVLLLALNAGGAVAFKQLRAKRATGDTTSSLGAVPPAANTPASPPPVETVAPGSSGTAAGNPLAGLVEEAVEETTQVDEQTEPAATTATEDGELQVKDDAS